MAFTRERYLPSPSSSDLEAGCRCREITIYQSHKHWVGAASPNACHIVHGNHLQHLDNVTELLWPLDQDLPLVLMLVLTLEVERKVPALMKMRTWNAIVPARS